VPSRQGESDGRYTAEQLLRSARAAGHNDVSRRLITDWVAIGLLDKATDRGRGQGRGKTYTWPKTQRDLFVALLNQREVTDVKRATLTNVPVVTWLLWGDAYVPLRQVRRALGTWTEQYGGARNQKQSLAGAREVLEGLAHRDATKADRQQLETAIAQAAGRATVDPETLAPLVRRVFDPHETGLTRGPLGLRDADGYIKLVVARMRGLMRTKIAADRDYYAARDTYQRFGPASTPTPLRIGGQIVTAQALGAETPSFEQIANSACLDLITVLGAQALAEDA